MDIYDIFQNFRINDLAREAGQAKSHARANEVSLQGLQDQIDHLSMVCLAMSELLEEIGFNKEMLVAKIQEIDLRDGKLDGKFTPAIHCSGCGRKLAPRHVTCLYCGAKVKSDSVAQSQHGR
ncbi:hypothetical protein [Shewanella sp. KCT]|uniref:hypothetical protein n=1 Tax=Shewanella sp. KCT TaxID=2569535 RepID=UPI001183FC90|nr:hypothetical protein [Shewanella sp. KCT]TVP16082.1 hypothetical protein AYI87_01235 [Shewanella sp. KCT]